MSSYNVFIEGKFATDSNVEQDWNLDALAPAFVPDDWSSWPLHFDYVPEACTGAVTDPFEDFGGVFKASLQASAVVQAHMR